MEATKQPLASIFNGHRIFYVPFYQRSYVWQKEQWSRFLEDMEFVTQEERDYFLGSAILKQQSTNMGESNDRRTIIDGQQRFTTLAIFSKVLCLKTGELDIFNQHFTVRNKKTKSRDYALVHSLYDRADFEEILEQSEDIAIEDPGKSNILQAYNFFQKEIDPDKLDIDTLLTHLVFIAIELQQEDDEQAIFDTINSLGVRLTTAELLKNYFFTERTVEEYKQMWVPTFEKSQDAIEYWNSQLTAGRLKRNNIDAFFAAFLNIKIQDNKIGVDNEHKLVYRRANSIFSSYKDFINTYNLDKNSLFQEIVKYADLYSQYINSDIVNSELPGHSCVERISFLIFTLDCSTMLPYILYILRNVKSEKERNDIFGYLESYIVRRAICKSENNSFSDLFAESLIGNEIKTFESLKDFLENRGDQVLAFPNDDFVRECLHENELPNKRALAILYLMETRVREGQPHATKLFAFTDYSLEHLMPKKFEKNWPLNDGYDSDTRKMMIGTLGNMAMLPSKLNSSISNADWKTKRDGKDSRKGLRYFASDLVTLKNVITCEQWDEDCIFDRAEWLANIAIKIWPSFLPDQEDNDFDLENETTLDMPEQKKSTTIKNINHDNTKYSFDGITFLSKTEFVVRLVAMYIQDHKDATYKDLKAIFKDKLCATGYKFLGFLCSEQEYNNWNNNYKEKRYQPNKPNHRHVSADGVVFFVNTQWTLEGMSKIVKLAKSQGFKVYSRKQS